MDANRGSILAVTDPNPLSKMGPAPPADIPGGTPPFEIKARPVLRRNFIDEHIFRKMERDNVPHAGLCTDEEFVRRVYLDLTGRIPTPDAVRAFVGNTDPEKRDKLVDSLIGTPAYVDYWTMRFGYLFQNTVYPATARGRNLFYEYLKEFVQKNTPYNKVVTDLITAQGDNWSSGPVNWLFREGEIGEMELWNDIYDNLAARASETFLGVRLVCISCHNGAGHLEKIDLWLSKRKRREFWGMAAFFANLNVEAESANDGFKFDLAGKGGEPYDMAAVGGVRPRRFGRPPRPVYIFNGKMAAPRKGRRAQLARMITSDPQFARATVNRLWAFFMNRGLVEPVDAFDLSRQDPAHPPPKPWTIQPSHPGLLAALAREFRVSRFDIRHIIKLICKSSAYQLSSRYDSTKWRDDYESYYARRRPRLLMGEEILDAIATATEVPASYKVSGFQAPVRWAIQLPGPEEPVYEEESLSALDILAAFGRGEGARAGVLQPLALMNSSFVDERISVTTGILARLLASNATQPEIVETLFLATLSRFPSQEERALALEALAENRNEGLEDLLWSLINKTDFIFNY